MRLTLQRLPQNGIATFGVLMENNIPFAVTLERIWANNERGVSCIPLGAYTCKRVQSPNFGNTFQIVDINDRSEILFHKGNINADSHGCILVGTSFGIVKDVPAIISSKTGFDKFLERVKYVDEFYLYITA